MKGRSAAIGLLFVGLSIIADRIAAVLRVHRAILEYVDCLVIGFAAAILFYGWSLYRKRIAALEDSRMEDARALHHNIRNSLMVLANHADEDKRSDAVQRILDTLKIHATAEEK